MTSPWTRGLAVEWAGPSHRIYDGRSALVESLDDAFGVTRFRVGEDSVSVVLANSIELRAGLSRMSLHSFAAGDATEEASFFADVIESVMNSLAAKGDSIRYYHQHLLGWPEVMDPHDAFRAAAQVTLAPVADALRPTDMAVLVDGDRPGGGGYQAEFGVVDGEQAPLRLARMMGRASGDRSVQHDVIMARSYPPVATFVDSTWWVPLEQDVEDYPAAAKQGLIESGQEADQLADALHRFMLSSIEVGGKQR